MEDLFHQFFEEPLKDAIDAYQAASTRGSGGATWQDMVLVVNYYLSCHVRDIILMIVKYTTSLWQNEDGRWVVEMLPIVPYGQDMILMIVKHTNVEGEVVVQGIIDKY